MFAGRQSELKRLNALYNSDKFEFAVIYGRRRVGKTALIKEFIKDKKTIYFAAQEINSRENLANLSQGIKSLRTGAGARLPDFNDFREAFLAIYDLSRTERIVMVIDEYPALASSCKDVAAVLQEVIDERLKQSRLMLIICGSSAPYMENEVLSYDSPFYGRRTAQIKVEPFTFFEVRRHYSGFSLYDIAVIYGAIGGVPRYLEMMDPELPVETNIRRCFFEPDAFLFEEPANLLRQEVREPALYNAVLKAIACGYVKNSEIASAVGLETSACTAYLKNLAAFGIVEKKTPVTEKSGKKTVYEIEDKLFRFWYRFIPENISYIMSGTADKIWRNVASQISVYMGRVFEEICTQWLISQNNSERLPVKLADIGRWWGTGVTRQEEAELAILAYSDDDNAVFAECVWSDEKADAEVLISLARKSELFRYRNRYLYLFSRSGFTEGCAEEALRTGVNLVMFE